MATCKRCGAPVEEYLTDLPPSRGWFSGGQRVDTFHLVRCETDVRMITYCGGTIPLPLVYEYRPENWTTDPLCDICKERVDRWRRARDAAPQSNTEAP